MANETSTVGLNLAGDFAARAMEAADAADALQAELDALKPPSAVDVAKNKIKALREEASAAEKALDKLNKRSDSAFDSAMKSFLGSKPSMPKELTPKIKPEFDFGKNAMGAAMGAIERVFGAGASSGLLAGASKLIAGAEALKPAMPLLKAGGSMLITGGKVVAGAAAALGVAAGALAFGAGKIVAGIASFGVEQTGMRQRVENAIGKDGYNVGIKVAGTYAIDKDKAFEQVKGLLAAKFASSEVPAIVRVAAGIGEMKGEGKASGFVEKMQSEMNKSGKASEDTIKGFAEVGINTDKVWAKLAAKLGVSIAQAKSKVKMGAVDMKTALEAVTEAGGADFGPVADKLGKSVFGLTNKVKIQFASMFSKFDLGPIEGALGNLSKVLSGPAGERFGGAMTKLGGAAIKALFGPFEGAEGEKRLTRLLDGMTNIAEKVTPVIEKLAPYILRLADALVTLFGEADQGKGKMDWLGEWASVLLNLDFGTLFGNIATAIVESLFGIDVFGSGNTAGLDLAAGFASGIAGGASAAISAAIGMAQGAVDAVRGALDMHSPSKAFAFIGGMSAEGFAQGANDNAAPAEAGKAMAESAVAGAAGVPGAEGAAGGGPGGAKGGGGGDGISITNVWPPGITPEAAAAVADANYEAWKRHKRANDREKQERAT